MYLEIFAAIGLILLFTAFYLENTGKYDKKHIKYNLFNTIGSLILGIYAVIVMNYIFIILEFIWFGISLYYILINIPSITKIDFYKTNTHPHENHLHEHKEHHEQQKQENI